MNIENKIFIGGLAPMTTQDTLFNFFSQYGELSEAKLVMDKNTGQSKCYAFIFFKELADAQRAVEGGSAVIDGKRCNCNLASSHTAQQQPQGDVPEVKKSVCRRYRAKHDKRYSTRCVFSIW
jgi:RNA recognition motif-containing protein